MPELLTLYHDVRGTSLYSHKVEVALLEANANYRSHKFDVYSKPEWYTTKVNPITGKIPAVIYGEPEDSNPENPSPSAFKLIESQVILEFVADLYPDSGLLPTDPTSRARVRFFMDAVSRYIEGPAITFIRGQDNYEPLLRGIEVIQGLLSEPVSDTGECFAVGERFTIADATIVPFIARLELAGKTGLGRFTAGMGIRFGEELKAPRYEKFRKYMDRMLERESMKKTFDMEHMEGVWREIFGGRR
ncbi:hypothetical protein PAXINDRAFT_169338 [Paxillus involutus ATCC 200175]|uniref:Glutathione transferase n=1 Tax=Paxillus involutus ATCC 200175 TaxID=664439 RepID=A0A0C9THS0_PAXIN|nr:hypothetical protein PAXINDRAFT_169338 [Paxillus involutus ATCC 200175]